MGGYLVNFAIYTMSMLGLIFLALMIYQKTTDNGNFRRKNSNFLEIEESISMGARKTLNVVRAGTERFLIASDIDKTSCIAKLDIGASVKPEHIYYAEDKNNRLSAVMKPSEQVSAKTAASIKKSVDELPVIVDFNKKKKVKNKVLQNILTKINE